MRHNWIPAWSHTFVEFDHEIISGHSPSADSRMVVSYKRKYVHEVLVNRLIMLAQEKGVVRLTNRLNMTRALNHNQTK